MQPQNNSSEKHFNHYVFILFYPFLANKPARIALTRFDGDYMNDRLSLAAEIQLIDDGSGTLKVWKIKNNDVTELTKERHGNFYSGQCYVLLYSYEVNSKLKYIIYYWLVCRVKQ